MEQQRPRYLVIAGPTASGKTALAIALAKRLNGEIVSADSMQIYDGISVGTARPSVEEMQGIPHHLLGFLPLSASYSVAQYVKDARRVIGEICDRGRLPILCGGTGLYLQALIENITFSDTAVSSDALRQELRARYEREGGAAMLAALQEVDPQAAARLHENDAGRIIRALEVYYLTGSTISQQAAASRSAPPEFEVCMPVLDFRDREKLYARIHARVDRMLEDGLLDEARRVLSGPYAPTAMQAIGYKELKPYFDGVLSLDTALEGLKKSTRHYAKRQLSWFRRMPQTRFLYVDDYENAEQLSEAALEIWLREGEAYT